MNIIYIIWIKWNTLVKLLDELIFHIKSYETIHCEYKNPVNIKKFIKIQKNNT